MRKGSAERAAEKTAAYSAVFPHDRIILFKETVQSFYRDNRRSFPWRETSDPYCIVVSELMLQQTQTSRVLGKYPQFLQAFPDFNVLAAASLRDVIRVWQGLGYNRRAKALKEIARIVVEEHGGKLPDNPDTLKTFPMIGSATAGSICAFAFNMPTVFIETNIRRLFIHFFFPEETVVHDRDILPIIDATLDRKNPREWYYALMDYGAYLAKAVPNPNMRSASYSKQPGFEGSNRQARGRILKMLSLGQGYTAAEIAELTGWQESRVKRVLDELTREGFIAQDGGTLRLSE